MEPRMMYCYTCDSEEEHRPLTANEKDWLRKRRERKYVEDVFMCKAPGCRNLRTGFDKHPFDPVIRMPLD